MVKQKEIEKYDIIYSTERLASFAYSENDTINEIVANYRDNIKISQAIYPELCTLEVILRNTINNILKEYISKTWIEDAINNKIQLDISEYKVLLKTYNDTKIECIEKSKDFSTGKVVAKLNFGFWTNLCVKKYNSLIWNKPRRFYGVFPNFNKKPSINYIAKKLYNIRRFRNRVFHYEKIFKYPERTLNLYNDILEMLSFLPNDNLKILKQTSTFLDTYNILVKRTTLPNKKT